MLVPPSYPWHDCYKRNMTWLWRCQNWHPSRSQGWSKSKMGSVARQAGAYSSGHPPPEPSRGCQYPLPATYPTVVSILICSTKTLYDTMQCRCQSAIITNSEQAHCAIVISWLMFRHYRLHNAGCIHCINFNINVYTTINTSWHCSVCVTR